jgi:hypothetical protein
MQVYDDFDEHDQVLLRRSLLAAAVTISTASPGRDEETVSEGFAAAAYILEHRDDYVRHPLISSVIAWLQEQAAEEAAFPDFVAATKAADARTGALETLRGVAALLDSRVEPEEASAYKGWLMAIASAVANAGKEDQGFLGRGGVEVNDRERAALAEIAAILGVPASAS